MSSTKKIDRLAEFRREQSRQIAALLQRNIWDFERLAAQLDLDIRTEEERSRNFDPSHVAYSMRAKAARVRRGNLRRSCGELRLHLKSILAALDDDHEQRPAA